MLGFQPEQGRAPNLFVEPNGTSWKPIRARVKFVASAQANFQRKDGALARDDQIAPLLEFSGSPSRMIAWLGSTAVRFAVGPRVRIRLPPAASPARTST